uniref:CSON001478 protein n=1 Tax=Culicoides sonorensis TaxID=179676 RepID=A0A336KZP4_CULSO
MANSYIEENLKINRVKNHINNIIPLSFTLNRVLLDLGVFSNFKFLSELDSEDIKNQIQTHIKEDWSRYQELFPLHYTSEKFKLNFVVLNQMNECAKYVKDKGALFFEKLKKGDLVYHDHPNYIKEVVEFLKREKNNCSILIQVLENIQSGKNEFTPELKQISLYIYLMVGPSVYTFFHHNLGLPSLTTIKKIYSSNYENIEEGELRVNGLCDFLKLNNLPKIVALSEDATKVIPKIEWDPSTNQLIGFKPHLNENGMNIRGLFKASSAKDVFDYFKSEQPTNYLYVIMAQPLTDKAPAFPLYVSGQPDFKKDDVDKRINFIISELNKRDIEVLLYSSDGDNRLLNTMLKTSKIGNQSEKLPNGWLEYFFADPYPKVCAIQDPNHVANKLKNRYYKKSNPLIFGNGQHASYSDLICLDQLNLKSVTGLSRTDLLNADPMSAKQAIKISSEEHLIPKLYYQTKDLFIVRIWKNILPRLEILLQALIIFNILGISSESFISMNAYECLEINAHNMLIIIKKLRDEGKQQYFLPWLYQSQTCEGLFRILRSMSTTMSTVVNFSVRDVLFRLKKLEIKHYLEKSLPHIGLKFPSAEDNGNNTITCDFLPSDEDLHKIVLEARTNAMNEMKSLIGETVFLNDTKCNLKPVLDTSISNFKNQEDIEIEESLIDILERADNDYDDDLENEVVSDFELLKQCEGVLTDESRLGGEISNNCFELLDSNKSKFYVNKKTFLWLLNNNHHVSADRMLRFQSVNTKINDMYRMSDPGLTRLNDLNRLDLIIINGRIGKIVDFRYIFDGKQKKPKISEYTFKGEKVDLKKSKNIGVLCNYYKLIKDKDIFFLVPSIKKDKSTFVSVADYETHIPHPEFKNGNLYYNQIIGKTIFDKIKYNN